MSKLRLALIVHGYGILFTKTATLQFTSLRAPSKERIKHYQKLNIVNNKDSNTNLNKPFKFTMEYTNNQVHGNDLAECIIQAVGVFLKCSPISLEFNFTLPMDLMDSLAREVLFTISLVPSA